VNTVIIEVSPASAGSTQDDLLAVPFFEGPRGPEPGPGAAEAARVIGADLPGLLDRQGFGGRPGDAATFLVPGGGPRRVVAVGAGPAGEASASVARDAAQRVATLVAGSVHVATTLGLLGPARAASVRAVAEGFLLGSYRVPRTGSRPVAGQQPAPP
jgi:leucyl aminopeptidase